jgi:hypothetical protein
MTAAAARTHPRIRRPPRRAFGASRREHCTTEPQRHQELPPGLRHLIRRSLGRHEFGETSTMETDEVLETGCGPDTPRGDNLLNDFVQGEADAYAELALARADCVVEDSTFGLMLSDGGSASVFGNVAVLRRPLADTEWPAAARRMHQFYADQPGGSFLVFSGWPTPDIHALGFGAIGHPPLMLRPPAPTLAPLPEGFEIHPVIDSRTAAQFERVMVLGYPVPELDPDVAGGIIGVTPTKAPHWRHFVGYIHDEPVATGSAFVDERHVHVEFISALETTRGRGIGAAITAAATSVEPELPAMLIASDLGKPVYERLGYISMMRFTLWTGHRGARDAATQSTP